MRIFIIPFVAASVLTATTVTFSPPVRADEESVIGVWRLASYLREGSAGGEELSRKFSDNTGGALVYTRGGRMMVLLKAANLVAYSGTYELTGGKVIHHVELSNIPDFVGFDLEREAIISGNLLTLVADSMFTDEKYTLIWQRIE